MCYDTYTECPLNKMELQSIDCTSWSMDTIIEQMKRLELSTFRLEI